MMIPSASTANRSEFGLHEYHEEIAERMGLGVYATPGSAAFGFQSWVDLYNTSQQIEAAATAAHDASAPSTPAVVATVAPSYNYSLPAYLQPGYAGSTLDRAVRAGYVPQSQSYPWGSPLTPEEWFAEGAIPTPIPGSRGSTITTPSLLPASTVHGAPTLVTPQHGTIPVQGDAGSNVTQREVNEGVLPRAESKTNWLLIGAVAAGAVVLMMGMKK